MLRTSAVLAAPLLAAAACTAPGHVASAVTGSARPPAFSAAPSSATPSAEGAGAAAVSAAPRTAARATTPAGRPKRVAVVLGPAGLVESRDPADVIQPQPAAGACATSGGGPFALPDPRCTPGAVNPAVTQADIGSTICADGWTGSVRPPESVSEPEKFASMTAYGDPPDAGAFEYDHLVPLELGGAANDPRNLWPEPGATPNPKDALENRLNALVCSGRLSLVAAQRTIARNWVAAYGEYVSAAATAGPGPAAPASPAPAPGHGGAGRAWCTATAARADDGYPQDYTVQVHSDEPDTRATASDANDTWSRYTDGSGYARITLYHTSAGEPIRVTVGAASCTTSA